jgi:hypothetical protein
LFPVLQSKDYKAAEPQLLKFLEDNDDEANAYFYLGEIIVSKLDSVEFFPSTEKYDSMTNLAIESYKKAISLVDEREVRKNDEYYIENIHRLLDAGLGNQILISHDRGWYDPALPGGGVPKPYTYLVETFLPKLEASGVERTVITKITEANPFRAFAR